MVSFRLVWGCCCCCCSALTFSALTRVTSQAIILSLFCRASMRSCGCRGITPLRIEGVLVPEFSPSSQSLCVRHRLAAAAVTPAGEGGDGRVGGSRGGEGVDRPVSEGSPSSSSPSFPGSAPTGGTQAAHSAGEALDAISARFVAEESLEDLRLLIVPTCLCSCILKGKKQAKRYTCIIVHYIMCFSYALKASASIRQRALVIEDSE